MYLHLFLAYIFSTLIFCVYAEADTHQYETYKAKEKETLSEILFQKKLFPIYGVGGTLQQTLELNPSKKITKGDLIYPGDEILLPILRAPEIREPAALEEKIETIERVEVAEEPLVEEVFAGKRWNFRVGVAAQSLEFKQTATTVQETAKFQTQPGPAYDIGVNFRPSNKNEFFVNYDFSQLTLSKSQAQSINKNEFNKGTINLGGIRNQNKFSIKYDYIYDQNPVIVEGQDTDIFLSDYAIHYLGLGVGYRPQLGNRFSFLVGASYYYPLASQSGEKISHELDGGGMYHLQIGSSYELKNHTYIEGQLYYKVYEIDQTVSSDFDSTKISSVQDVSLLGFRMGYHF